MVYSTLLKSLCLLLCMYIPLVVVVAHCLIDAMPFVTDATLSVTEGPGGALRPVCVNSGIDNNGLIELPLSVTFSLTDGKASEYIIYSIAHVHVCTYVHACIWGTVLKSIAGIYVTLNYLHLYVYLSKKKLSMLHFFCFLLPQLQSVPCQTLRFPY